MHFTGSSAPSDRPRGTAGFGLAVLRAVSWRAVLATQALGFLLALFPWLKLWGLSGQAPMLLNLANQELAALFVMLAALAGDQAVRRGWPVWRAFVLALLCAASAATLMQWGLRDTFDRADPNRETLEALNAFFNICTYWGMVMMVYLNRQSTARILAGVRTVELERVQAESWLVTSRLAAAEMQIDAGSLLRQLARVRDLYAAGRPVADQTLEELIADLRGRVLPSGAAVPGPAPGSCEASP